MKTTRIFSLCFLLSLLVALALAACGQAGPTPAPDATLPPSAATSTPAPAAPESLPTLSQQPTAADGVAFPDPLRGLEALESPYRQTLTITLKGQRAGSPYEETQTIERSVLGEGVRLVVHGSSSDTAPVYLSETFQDGFRYAQHREDASCRAEPAGDRAPSAPGDLTRRLPVPAAMQPGGSETVNGRALERYDFDQSVLPARDATLTAASGQAWVDEVSGLLWKYDLSVELQAGEFQGTRTYAYALEALEPEVVALLPESCPAVLHDLPTLPGAQDTVLLPGFASYRAPAGRAEAVAFYYDKLTAQGWAALPGSAPEAAEVSGAATVLAYSQTYGSGGRVLVVQLAEEGEMLRVIAQSARTKEVAQPGAPAAAPSGEEEPQEPPDAADDGSNLVGLPAGLPEYPGQSVMMRQESMLMVKVDAPQAEAVAFYTAALKEAGWESRFEREQGGMYTQMWARDGVMLSLTVLELGNGSQVTLTAMGEE